MKFFYFVFASLVVGCASTPNALRSGAEVRSDPRPHAHAARSSVRSAARSVGEQAASKLERGNRIQTDARRRITREIQKEIKSLENHRTRQKISSAHTVANLEKATIERGANAPALAASTPVSTEAALRASPLLSDSGMTATDSTLAPSPADSRLVGELAPMQRPPSKTKRVPVLVNPEFQSGEIATSPEAEVTVLPAGPLKHLKTFEARDVQLSPKNNTPLIFELPVTYNDRVKSWINYFQTDGRLSFRRWLERSTRYLPYIQSELEAARMPQDLIYVAMIESGFSPGAVSPAHAVGMWQFIRATGNRYGLRTTWWLDERRDVYKSTKAAIAYMQDLYKMFGSWYLVAASYNMGEGGVKRLIKKYNSNDFWELADRGALPEETKNYVPKILAAMLIAKAPSLYGFRDLQNYLPQSYEYAVVPGGTGLANLAAYLGVSGKYLQELNPELIKGYVPPEIPGHRIRVPKGSASIVSQYVRMQDPVASSGTTEISSDMTFN